MASTAIGAAVAGPDDGDRGGVSGGLPDDPVSLAGQAEGASSPTLQTRPSAARGFQKNLAADLALLNQHSLQACLEERSIRYFAQDESRFGVHTLMGRLITACGIKPIGQWQWLFQAFWLYGAVEPTTGDSFFLQFSHADTQCYQRFLDEFAQAYPDSLNILQVDRGRFHTSKALVVPENVILLFQPPYCPELNPIERLWKHLKAELKWASFQSLESLQTKVDDLLSQLTPERIASITGYPFILDALSALNAI